MSTGLPAEDPRELLPDAPLDLNGSMAPRFKDEKVHLSSLYADDKVYISSFYQDEEVYLSSFYSSARHICGNHRW